MVAKAAGCVCPVRSQSRARCVVAEQFKVIDRDRPKSLEQQVLARRFDTRTGSLELTPTSCAAAPSSRRAAGRVDESRLGTGPQASSVICPEVSTRREEPLQPVHHGPESPVTTQSQTLLGTRPWHTCALGRRHVNSLSRTTTAGEVCDAALTRLRCQVRAVPRGPGVCDVLPGLHRVRHS